METLPLGEAMRAAQLARVLAKTNRYLADVTERRARQVTTNSAMHLRAARRLRIKAMAQEIEARRHLRSVAQLRLMMS